MGRYLDIIEITKRYELALLADGKSKKTVVSYNYVLESFYRYATESIGDTSIYRFTIDDIRKYILYLQIRPKFQGHPFTPPRGEG